MSVGDQNRTGSPISTTAREAVRLLAGIADIGLGTAEAAVRRARGLLARSDLVDLTTDLHREVRAHGDVVLDRVTPTSVAHMERLARRAAAEPAGPSESPASPKRTVAAEQSTTSSSTTEQRRPPLGSYGDFGGA